MRCWLCSRKFSRAQTHKHADADRCQLDEGEVVGRAFVVVGGDTPTLNHPLAKLARTEDWRILEGRFGEVYADDPGHPPLPTRLMAGRHAQRRD
jgi:hypothetical protein